MLIDFVQNSDSIELSYVDENGSIKDKKMPLKSGYFKIDTAEDYEVEGNPNIIQGYRSYKNKKHLKIVPSYRFNHQSKYFFLDNLLPKFDKSLYDEVMALRLPKIFSVDIETEITDEFGYSTPEKAENRITWITITDMNLNSIGYALKTEFTEKYVGENNLIHERYLNVIKQDLRDKYHDSQYLNLIEKANINVVFFDNERDMIVSYLNDVRLYYTCQIGHNFYGFDQTYIENRCKLLNIPITISSPSGQTKRIKYGVEENKNGIKEKPEVIIPRHRPILDNLWMFKESLSYNNLESYKLEDLGQRVLKSGKVSYDGNLRTLYENETVKFMTYAFVDTILLMMIQLKTSLYQVEFYETYLNKVPFLEITQNAISESLLFFTLKKKNLILPISEYNITEKRDYKGAYVKSPTDKIVESVLGLDYSGLYVTLIIVLGISPEARVDKINVDMYGYPLTDNDMEIWMNWKNKGFYILSPKGYIYDNNTTPLFVEIQLDTRSKRSIFKAFSEDTYINIMSIIEDRIAELKGETVQH